MAYPESYDELTDLDLGECALYAHTLTDGILDTTSNIELDSRYYVYAIYGSAVPKLDIIDPLNDELFVSAIEGEYLENASLYRFTVDVPTAYTTAEGETSWAEKGAVLKLYSDDSPLIFRKHIDIITKSCTPAELCATMDRAIESLDTIKDTDVKQSNSLTQLKNGWGIIH